MIFRSLISVFFFFLVASNALWAQYEAPKEKQISAEEKARRGDKLKAYRIRSYTGTPEQVNLLDTVAQGSHNYVAPERRSLGVAYAGNANHPWQSKLFFDRAPKPHDFVALSGYQGMLYSPDNVLFYDTKVPLTFVHYRKNFSDNVLEEVLNGTIAVNLNKKINLGISADHASARGYYVNNKSRNIDYRIFGSYNSDRYDLWAYISNDYYKQQENGGIADMTYISNPDKYSSGRVKLSSLDIPVVLTEGLYNRIRSGNAFLSHRYKLGYKKKVETIHTQQKTSNKATDRGGEGQRDISKHIETEQRLDSMIFIPVGSISHQLHYNKSSRRMIAPSASDTWGTIWGAPVVNAQTTTSTTTDATGATTTTTTTTIQPNDVTEFKTLKNTLALSLLEGFRPWVKAGVSAYIRSENYWAYSLDATTRSRETSDKSFSLFAGGELARYSGKGLNFSARGELGILGRDIGAVSLEGDIKTKFSLLKKDFALRLDGRLMNFRAPYFALHNHHTWAWEDKDLSFTRRLELGAKAELSTYGTWVELRTASLQNHIYWTNDAKVAQATDLIQMSMLRAGHTYNVGFLGWSFEGAYQLNTHNNIIPVPSLSLRGDVYFDFMIAKVLQVQLGTEAYWHSTYHAPYYHPAVMQFVNQSTDEIGGKAPLVNAYANFRMRTTRFYVRMFNIGEMLFTPQRETMKSYVYNPTHLEAGVVIDLKN